MSDSRTINGAVRVEETTKEEVAFKLMNTISGYESSESGQKNREYWLTLYRQCYKATSGHKLKSVLDKDES